MIDRVKDLLSTLVKAQRDYKTYIENLRKDAFIQINDEMIPKG